MWSITKNFGELLANHGHVLPFKIVWPSGDSRDPFSNQGINNVVLSVRRTVSLLDQTDETYADPGLLDDVEGFHWVRNFTGICVDDVTEKPGLDGGSATRCYGCS